MPVFDRCFLLSVLVLQVCRVHGEFRWYCDLRYEPIVELQWNPSKQSYQPVHDRKLLQQEDSLLVLPDELSPEDPSLGSSDGKEWLRGSSSQEEEYGDDSHSSFDYHNHQTALSVSIQEEQNRDLQHLDNSSWFYNNNESSDDDRVVGGNNQNINNNDQPSIVRARRCPCWKSPAQGGSRQKDFYCPLPRTHCGLGSGWASVQDAHTSRTTTTFYFRDPGCVDITRPESFARNVWPVVTVWYLAVVLCLLLTRSGRHAMGCCVSCIFPQWNIHATNRIMRDHPGLTNRIVIRRQIQDTVENNNNNNDNNNNNTQQQQQRISYAGFEVTFEITPANESGAREEVLLRTKTFHYHNNNHHHRTLATPNHDAAAAAAGSPNNDCTFVAETIPPSSCQTESEVKSVSNLKTTAEPAKDVNHKHDHHHERNVYDDEEENPLITCAICHTEMEDGDRVGDLPCNHVMHIECLKTWIVRRNVCPLCLAENIATPRRHSRESNNHDDSTIHPIDLHRPGLVVTGE
ncbi:protein ligase RNF12 [Seminavis robusta]|uniref:Protein ligase RNF12 n=1 Tax=Seminavis robusta TaxID=568900 RepID=A0A9N8DF87_9STRA|nr:protein ligase RNF12 [Seminavis robusta]|eukprot:Sro66_g037140.1 protein ligase RNF12 (517) ;mRNA; r:56444-58074